MFMDNLLMDDGMMGHQRLAGRTTPGTKKEQRIQMDIFNFFSKLPDTAITAHAKWKFTGPIPDPQTALLTF